MIFAEYMGLFNGAMQKYAEINKEDGGPYMLRWVNRTDPNTQHSEYHETLDLAAMRAHELARIAKNGEVLAYVGDGCVWRTYWPATGSGPLIGAGPQMAGVVEKRESRDMGTGVRYAGVFTLQFRKSRTQPLTTVQYVGLVPAMFAAHTLVRKYNTKVVIYSAEGTRRFTVSGVHDPVFRPVYPNRSKSKRFAPPVDTATPKAEPFTPATPLAAVLDALDEGAARAPTRADTDADEQGNTFGYDEDDTITGHGAVPSPPIIEPAVASSNDDLPVPPFRPGHTHFLYTKEGIAWLYGAEPKDPKELAAYNLAWKYLPHENDRAMYREMFPGGKP
jgi:hypothetical protein